MATKIDKLTAKNLIKDFQRQNNAPTANQKTLTTHTGVPLKGFFIDKSSLQAAMANPACVGIHVVMAKHPDHVGLDNMTFTLVFAGAKPNPAYTAGSTTVPQYLNDGDPYEYVDPCPPVCGDLSS